MAHFKKYGKRMVDAMRWAETQKKQIVEENIFADERMVAWSSEFNDQQGNAAAFIENASESFAALYIHY